MNKKFYIPIYDVWLHLVVSRKVEAERKKLDHIFDPMPATGYEGWTGLHCYAGQHFGIFIDQNHICVNIIAHEVFHLTHRILDYIHANFDSEHHETAAVLHGYLMELVMKHVKRYLR